jgi:hypothetical protein
MDDGIWWGPHQIPEPLPQALMSDGAAPDLHLPRSNLPSLSNHSAPVDEIQILGTKS